MLSDAAQDLENEKNIRSSPELPPPMPIELDDVLNAALLDDKVDMTMLEMLESDDGVSKTSGKSLLLNFKRWERVPIGAYRRLRTAGSVNSNQNAARLADGFSYGSTSTTSGLSPQTTRSSTLWEASWLPPRTSRPQKQKTLHTRSGRVIPQISAGIESPSASRGRSTKRKVLVSPVLLPMKDSDTDQGLNDIGGEDLLDEAALPPAPKRQRREEDKKASLLFSPAWSSTPSRSPRVT